MLTPRECAVARLIADSKTDREIAAALGISYHTVRGYTKTIFKKLAIRKRTGVLPLLPPEGAPHAEAK